MYGIILKGYDTFKCIADKCMDTCCIGWTVFVDSQSAKRYLKDPYLKQNITKIQDKDVERYILKMDSNNRCTFLNENGLCDMITKRSEDHLCLTCTEYPRLRKLYGGNIFFSLTFSCEAAISHMLKDDSTLEFEVVELDSVPNINDRYWIAANKFTNETNFEIFNTSMAILQNRQHKLYEKIAYLYMMYQNIDELEKNENQEINDVNVDTILSQYLQNLNNEELFGVIKNVKANEGVFDKADLLKSLDTIFSEVRTLLHSQNPLTLSKIQNSKNLSEYSDEDINTYNKKFITFINNNELMLEKYLILTMVESVFPTMFEKLEDAMTYMLIRILLIQTTIISLNIETLNTESSNEITEELFFESLRITSKAFEHNKNNISLLSNYVAENKPSFKILMNIIL